MRSAPFLVLNRSNRRVIHQAASLAEARGFVEGHPCVTTIAILAETSGKAETDFCIQVVNEAGGILATSRPFDFFDAIEQFVGARMLLVPRCLAGEVHA